MQPDKPALHEPTDEDMPERTEIDWVNAWGVVTSELSLPWGATARRVVEVVRERVAEQRDLYEMTREERDALANAMEAVRGVEPAMVIPEHVNEWSPAEAFFEGTVHAAQAFRAAVVDAIRAAMVKDASDAG